LAEENYTVQKVVEYIISMQRGSLLKLGRNLDHYIETHIHGSVSILEDVESLHIDESFASTNVEDYAKRLANQYNIELCYIPKRQFPINEIDDVWRGPLARPLADRINTVFNGNGMLDAALIGIASQDSVSNKSSWLDIGTEFDLFQNFKYLWHYLAHFG